MGGLEGFFEVVGESVEALGTESLLLSPGLASLFVFSLELSETSLFLGEGVQFLHHGSVLKRVLLGLVMDTARFVGADFAENLLDLFGVDNTGNILAGERVAGQLVSSLLNTLNTVGAENVIEGLESILGEDDKSSEVTTRGELEEVEAVNVAGVNSTEVASGTLDGGVVVSVDNKRSLSESEAGGSEFTNTSAGVLVSADSSEIILGTELVEGGEEGLGVVKVQVVDDEREFRDVLNEVTTGLNERSASGGSEGRGDSMSLLVNVDLSVPFSPDLEGSEHTSLSAHVTEGSLS